MFLTILVAVAYTFLTMATTKDIQLITNTNSSKLPVIGTEIPIVGFYVATPLILLALFVYFHIYLQRLWEAIAKLPAIFPNGRRLDEGTHPWLMNDLARQHFPRLRRPALPLSGLQVVVSILGGYWLVPATIVALWMQFLRVESWRITTLHLVIIAFVVGSAAYYTRLRHKTLGKKALRLSLVARIVSWMGIFRGVPAGLFALLAAFYCAFLVLEWDKRMDPFWMASLDPGYTPSRPMFMGEQILWVVSKMGIERAPFVDNADISTKPPSWTGLDANRDAELALCKGAAFEGTASSFKRFRKIYARHAFFAKAVLTYVDLNLSDFTDADFRLANIRHTKAVGSVFNHCQFSDPVLLPGVAPADDSFEKAHAAFFEECYFGGAWFDQANMSFVRARYSDFRRASFFEARCVGTLFEECWLERSEFRNAHCNYAFFNQEKAASFQQPPTLKAVDFSGADCSDAKFVGCNLSSATFDSAVLDRATFENVDLTGAYFGKASLQDTDVSTAKGLTEQQLRQAKTLYHAKLPSNLAVKMATEIETPPVKD